MLKVALEDEGVDTWDWMIRDLADGDPLRMRKIRRTVPRDELAKAFAMKRYTDSAEPKE